MSRYPSLALGGLLTGLSPSFFHADQRGEPTFPGFSLKQAPALQTPPRGGSSIRARPGVDFTAYSINIKVVGNDETSQLKLFLVLKYILMESSPANPTQGCVLNQSKARC